MSSSDQATTTASSKAQKLRLGVVGVGYLGRFHARIYNDMPGVELVGVVDIDRSTVQSVAGQLGCAAYTDHADLLDKV
ncbi:MAG: Gfo/Idh/MocA family oxidoreductase, partial [Acidiferrobacterales bacterium]